jgi:hypothetical protein
MFKQRPLGSQDVWSGALLGIIGAAITAGAAKIGVGTLASPDSGFLSFYLGLVLLAVGGGIAVNGLRATEGAKDIRESLRGWSLLLPVVAALIAYSLILERTGFLISTFVLLWWLLAFARRSFLSPGPAVWAAAITGATYLVFETLLGAGLPGWPF